MPAHRKTSLAQIMELLLYLEKHKDIQLGTVAAKGLGKKENEHWQNLAQILNNCPGEPKDASKWKSYWNELKSQCRKKATEGRTLLPHEKRVMNLVGTVMRYPPYIIPKEGLKIEQKENSEERLEDNSDADSPEMDYDSSRLPDNQDQDCMTPDPMPIVDSAVETCHSDQEEEEKAKPNPASGDVPEWVRKVEHSRLCLEERTTVAIEHMCVGINSIGAAMHNIVASLQSIEASIKELNNKS